MGVFGAFFSFPPGRCTPRKPSCCLAAVFSKKIDKKHKRGKKAPNHQTFADEFEEYKKKNQTCLEMICSRLKFHAAAGEAGKGLD